MKALSIRSTLGVVIGLLGLLLVAVSAIALMGALERYRAAQKVATLAPISQSFFDSLQAHRLERGNVLIALGNPQPAEKTVTDGIAEQRANAQKGFSSGFAGLAQLRNMPGAEALLGRLKSTHDAVEALRPRMTANLSQSGAQRDAQLARDWPQVTQAFLSAVEAASDYLEKSLMLVDPLADQLLSAKDNAWTMRNFGGSLVLRLLTSLGTQKTWGSVEIAANAEERGRMLTAHDSLADIATLPGIPKALVDSIKKADGFFNGPLAQERQVVVRALSEGQIPDIDRAQFQARAVEGLSLLNDVANTALTELVLRANAQTVASRNALIFNSAMLAAALIFTAIGFLIVQSRVSGPILRMTGTMQKLADRDLTVEIPFVDRGAEIGAMAKAVQVFKDNMLAREKAEADIARQREEAERQRQEREAREKQAGEEIAVLVNKVAQGDLSGRIDETGKDGFFLTTSSELNRLATTLQTMNQELAQTMGAMADGDLTKSVRGDYRGVFGEIKNDVNAMAERMRTFAGRLTDTAQSVKIASDEISTGSQDLAQRTESQAASIEETAASMHEITATVKQNADNAQAASQLAVAARDTAEKGGNVTQQAVTAVSRIEESARKISDIMTLIDEIAFQTNLLALNASVEAARAGEAGKGFAVVAQEVRALAQRSANASKEIKSLIGESNTQVKSGATLVNQTGGSLTEIVTAIKKVSDIVAEIAAASREQATGLDQINTAIGNMDEITQRNAALVEETTASAQSLASQATELADLVGFFKLDTKAPAIPGANPGPKTTPGPAAAANPTKPAQPAKAMVPVAPRVAPQATPLSAPRAATRATSPAAPLAPARAIVSNDDDDWKEF